VKTESPGKGGKTWENRAGLDALSLRLLAEDFAPLDELADKMASRVMRYLADGAGGNVLAELASLRRAGQKLRLRVAVPVPPAEGESPRSRFFQTVRCSAPQFFVRLGRVYEAASRPLRFRMSRAFGGPELDWLQVLLIEATQLTLHTWPRRCRPCAALTADLIEAMLETEGHPRDLLARTAFQPAGPARRMFGPDLEPVWESLPGLGESAGRHAEAVLAALSQSYFKPQLQALKLMKKCQAPPAPFLGKLFELACGRSLRVRAQAQLMLAEAQPESLPFLRERAIQGSSGERRCAARILWRAEGENARAFLAARILEEKNKKVARVLEELLGAHLDHAALGSDQALPMKQVGASSPRPSPPQVCGGEGEEARALKELPGADLDAGRNEILAPELPPWWKLALGPKAGRLARLGSAPAIAPLLAALKKEKNEATRSAMMTSLARLGVPPEQFLDRAGLLEESARGLAEGIPEPLSWFPFPRLPPVHWADNGRLVEPQIVRWWLAQCCRRKSPDPGPLLRQYAAGLKTSGREALGQFVLETWIRQDTIPSACAEAGFLGGRPHKALRGATRQSRNQGLLHQPKVSAIASKGILALAGACAAAGAVPLVHRYLEEWYGQRAAQCRALLQMLAWVEHPAAAQLLRAVGSGFRTRSIQEEASRQAEYRAERKGGAEWKLA